MAAATKAPELDAACAGAVDLAREAAERRSGVMGVGEHLAVVPEGTRVATHYFAVDHPGYVGWQWAVTVARASRARAVTVDEVCMPSYTSRPTGPWWCGRPGWGRNPFAWRTRPSLWPMGASA